MWSGLVDLLVRPLHRRRSALPPALYGVDAAGPFEPEDTGEHAELFAGDGSLLPFDGPLERIPQSRAEAIRVYGHPGVGGLDPAWERAHMVLARDLPLVPGGRLYTNRMAEPYVREALRRAAILVPTWEPKRVGCFCYRPQRHDPTRPLSWHAFGVAIDIDPENNLAWTRHDRWDRPRRRGPVPQPFSDAWRELFPRGLPEEAVRAFESVGWRWGGRWRRRPDPMHFELYV